MKKTNDTKIKLPKSYLQSPKEKRFKQAQLTTICSVLAIVCLFMVMPAMAADPVDAGGDPLEAITNLSDFFFSAIKLVGIIITGVGVVTLGMSFKSHDPSQRANGIMGVFGGLLVAFAKGIIDLIIT